MAIALAVGTLFSSPVAALTDLEAAIEGFIEDETVTLEQVESIVEDISPETTEEIVAQLPERPWTGSGLSPQEMTVLNFFQDQGITDRAALATLMGNIKQESKFETNICEGGHRGPYHTCRRGGFGLIQWTTVGRYQGLGRHANQIGGNPDTLDTQLSYLVTEVEWKKVEHLFQRPGGSVGFYMNAAYRWLGWGVHGARTTYSHQYMDKIVQNK